MSMCTPNERNAKNRMPSPSSRQSAYARSVAYTLFITTFFAFVWGVNGSVALPGTIRIVCLCGVLVISAVLFGMAFLLLRSTSDLPTATTQAINPFRTRLYNLAVSAQFIAIFLGAQLLSRIGYADAIISLVAVIVGLHFFALIPVFQSWRFAGVGSAMVLLGLGSLLLAPSMTLASTGETVGVRTAIVGLGCAIILWAGVAPLVYLTWQQLRYGSH